MVLARSSEARCNSKPLRGRQTFKVTDPFSVNLNALERRFFKICSTRCVSVCSAAGRPVFDLQGECDALFLGDRRKLLLQPFDDAVERGVFGNDVQLAGLDLGEIEDIVDQVQEFEAVIVNDAGFLDLFVGEIAALVAGQRPRQDEQAVERRAQLMRHVGEEFRFVFAGELDFLGFLLDQQLASRQLLGLLPDLRVLLFQLLIRGLDLFVRCLQLLLLHFQLFFAALQLLRIFEELFLRALTGALVDPDREAR